jgi:hypothetical protein
MSEQQFVIHERWYLPPTSDTESVAAVICYVRMPFFQALAAIQRWRAAQSTVGGGLSDFWMAPA